MAKMNMAPSDDAREAVVIAIVYLWRSKPETRDSHIEYVSQSQILTLTLTLGGYHPCTPTLGRAVVA